MTGYLHIQAALGMQHHFPADTVIEATSTSAAGLSQADPIRLPNHTPTHGPQLPSTYDDDDDDVYSNATRGYHQSPYSGYSNSMYSSYPRYVPPKWNEKSQTGWVTLENKASPSYLTSVLQILYHNAQFRQFVYSWPYGDWMTAQVKQSGDRELDEARNQIERLGIVEDRSVMAQLLKLFARMQLLPERHTKVDAFLKAFGKGTTFQAFQVEVDEFLAHLFNRIEEECLGTPLEGKVEQLFKVSMRSLVCCKSCGNDSVRSESAPCWKVEMRLVNADSATGWDLVRSLHDGAQLFLSADEVPYNCHMCQSEVVAVRRKEVVLLPPLFFVHLNRFVFVTEFDRRSKLRHRVDFPMHLMTSQYARLAEEVEEEQAIANLLDCNEEAAGAGAIAIDAKFNLCGVVCHSGSSITGLYNGLVKGAGKADWYKFSDTEVEHVDNLQGAMEVAMGAFALNDEGDECAFLLTYVTEDAPQRAPDVADVPMFLQEIINEEHEARAQRKGRKEMERQMSVLKVLYRDETLELRIHGSKTVDEATVMAAQLFGIDKRMARERYRLRHYDTYNDIPKQSYGSVLKDRISSLRFYHSEILTIETLEDHEVEFREYHVGCLTVKVFAYDSSSGSFGPYKAVTLFSRMETLGTMKRTLEREFGIPAAEQRLFKENSSIVAELVGDTEEVNYKLGVQDGTHIYVEHSKGAPSDPSACAAEVERVKNSVSLHYWFEEKLDQEVAIDQRETLYTLKQVIAERENLEMGHFKMCQAFSGDVSVQLKNDDQPLSDFVPSYSRDPPTKFVVERFTPHDAKVIRVAFCIADENGGKMEALTEEEHCRVDEPVDIIKERMSKLISPNRLEGKQLRLREVGCGATLGNILPPSLSLKQGAELLYGGMRIAVELLNCSDAKTENVIVVKVVMFRGDWTLSAPREIVLNRKLLTTELYDRAAGEFKLGVELVGIAKASSGQMTALDAPHLDWDPRIPKFIKSASDAVSRTITTAPLYLRDGDLLVVRDRTEAMQTLTDDKIRSLKGYKTLEVDRAKESE